MRNQPHHWLPNLCLAFLQFRWQLPQHTLRLYWGGPVTLRSSVLYDRTTSEPVVYTYKRFPAIQPAYLLTCIPAYLPTYLPVWCHSQSPRLAQGIGLVKKGQSAPRPLSPSLSPFPFSLSGSLSVWRKKKLTDVWHKQHVPACLPH